MGDWVCSCDQSHLYPCVSAILLKVLS